MINLMMAVGLYPVLLIIYFTVKHTAMPKNGMAFGSKVKAEWIKDPGIEQIKEEFIREMRRDFWILMVLPVAVLFSKHMSIQFTVWMLWMLAIIVVMYLPYVRANKKVRELKIENGWYDSEKKNRLVELKAAGQVRRVKWNTLAVPIFFNMLLVACTYFTDRLRDVDAGEVQRVEVFRVIILILALTSVALCICAWWTDGWKTRVISSDSDVNLNYTRAQKQVWKQFWMWSVWGNTVYVMLSAIALMVDFQFGNVVLWGAIADTVYVLILIARVSQKLRNIERNYESLKDLQDETDDDRNWIGGCLYYNPNDKHTLVNTRLGVGTSVNFATPVGKILAVLSVIALLSIPCMCVWLVLEEFVPIHLSVEDACITAKHLKVEYEIPLSEVEELEIVEELPSRSKVAGTSMDRLSKGTFFNREMGKFNMFLNKDCTMFLKFTAEDRVYYMSGATDEETLRVLEQMDMEYLLEEE